MGEVRQYLELRGQLSGEFRMAESGAPTVVRVISLPTCVS
jgi:hypothetical protein